MTLDLDTKTNLPDDYCFSNDEPTDSDQIADQILIVDDEEIVRHFHFDCLSSRRKCFEAASAEEALEILKEEKISLVITDWVMSGMSGKMLLHRIVQEFPDTFVIMVSGINHPDRSLDAMRLGAFNYILKPSKPELLELIVEQALAFRKIKIKNRQYKIDLKMQELELTKHKYNLEKNERQLRNTEANNWVKNSLAELSVRLKDHSEYMSDDLRILERYFQNLRELLETYETAEIAEEKLSEIKRVKAKINGEEIFENIKLLIDGCAEENEKVSLLFQNVLKI